MVPPVRLRSEEIDGNSAVVSAGAVAAMRPHSFPASARYGSQHHGHLRGVVVAGRARAPAQSLLGTSAGSLLGTSAVQPCSMIRVISAVCSSSVPTTSSSASWARIFIDNFISPSSLYRLAIISCEPPPPPPPALEPSSCLLARMLDAFSHHHQLRRRRRSGRWQLSTTRALRR